MAQHRVDDVAHRQHDPAQLDELLAHPVGAHLHGVRAAALVEEQVLEALDRVVELLDRLEVPVDDGVEQAVHERADAELRAARGSSFQRSSTWLHVEVVAAADGDDARAAGRRPRSGSSAGGTRGRRGSASVGVRRRCRRLEPGRVDGEEGVLGVPGRLGSLAGGDGVLDGVRVEAELRGQGAQAGVVRLAQVDPDAASPHARGARTRPRGGSPRRRPCRAPTGRR